MYARHIDPATGQYVIERGVFVRAASPAVAKVVRRMKTKRGSIKVAPWLGHRFDELRKLTSDAGLRARAYAFDAVQDMIDAKEIRDLIVKVDVVRREGGAVLALELSFTDNRGVRRVVPYSHKLTG